MSALLLATVGGAWWKSSITLAANHLVAVVLSSQHLKGRFDGTTSKTKNKMESGLLLNVVIAQCPAVLKLFAGENESLLVWGDSFLILDLRFHVVNRVGSLHIKGDGLTSQGLDEDPH